MAKRAGVLEFAVLGLLQDNPMHGYELRKRLNGVLGSFRAISYGSLYPCLKDLLARGLIEEDGPADAGAPTLSGRRAKVVYRLTADGKERLTDLLDDAGPQAWEDESFGVHLAFFGRTNSEVRMRILQGRSSRLEERLASLRASLTRSRERLDSYTLQLQQHGLDSVEREVTWLRELIESESQTIPNNSGVGQSARPRT
ncbi:MAG: PadR family transcriptional regulator [Candidatus Nanopelagicales bacterium]|nr:PadR family transcriptional regulator [Candidatus Nanopelagicales bacterium]MDZ4248813.1 PadR family transcriptional regulator [Candidatus Nanopelagicales bacterium]MDZ7578721.1 PadR family transcriptional regulator [Candidatus Nanopelagicales bacterium]